jgi:prepilin-type N-terminal cleavage/methylation domain-containing protein
MEKNKNFTLIEMLIVIAIIAVLIALLMPVIGKMSKRAKETRAKAEMQSIITAVKSYESTYGLLPCPTPSPAADTVLPGDAAYDTMMNVLTNVPAASNARSIRFLDVPEGYAANGYVDPWGNKYNIYVDTNYDGQIANVGPAGNVTNPAYGTVFIYSTANGAASTNDYVYSWK